MVLAMLFLVASCASAYRGPTTVEEWSAPRATTDSSEQLAEGMVRFSTSMNAALNDPAAEPPASNSYSHQKWLGWKKRLGEPRVQLEATDAHSTLASTDCSGWLSFVLNTV